MYSSRSILPLVAFAASSLARTATAQETAEPPPSTPVPAAEPATTATPTDTAPSAPFKLPERKPQGSDEKLPTVHSPAMARLLRRQITWDLNLEGGLGGVWATPPHHAIGFARAGAGVTFVRDPFFDTLRVTYEYSGLSPATFGLQAEVAWLERGFWAQAGLLYDVSARSGVMASLGWAIFGVEADYRNAEQTGRAWALYAKLRLPVSIFVRAVQ